MWCQTKAMTMKWNELVRAAKAAGFEKLRHGASHDVYENRATGKRLIIERHPAAEVPKGLLRKLLKDIGL